MNSNRGRMQFNAVQAGFASASGASGKLVDRLLDLVASHRLTEEKHKGSDLLVELSAFFLILDAADVLLAAEC